MHICAIHIYKYVPFGNALVNNRLCIQQKIPIAWWHYGDHKLSAQYIIPVFAMILLWINLIFSQLYKSML